jgi:hypothetical protein
MRDVQHEGSFRHLGLIKQFGYVVSGRHTGRGANFWPDKISREVHFYFFDYAFLAFLGL